MKELISELSEAQTKKALYQARFDALAEAVNRWLSPLREGHHLSQTVNLSFRKSYELRAGDQAIAFDLSKQSAPGLFLLTAFFEDQKEEMQIETVETSEGSSWIIASRFSGKEFNEAALQKFILLSLKKSLGKG